VTLTPHDQAIRRDEEAALWCLRMADAPLCTEDQGALDRWIDSDPANAAALEDAVAVWQAIDASTTMPEMIRYRADAVESLRQANARRWGRERFERWRWPVAVAACFAMVMLVGALFFYDPARVYETEVGERRVVTLADGTRLTLDGASRVDVRMERDRRRLQLVSGRAKFDVAHDPLRPLSVLANNRLTVATGTAFSVELLSGQVRVILYEGAVEVMAQGADGESRRLLAPRAEAERLTPGRELIASTVDTRLRVAETDVARSLTWESGSLSFDREPLQLAVERLNRDARAKLIIEDRAIAAYPISGTFVAGDVDAFVEGIGALYPVVVTRSEAGIALKRR
jgi:transmembrane sensor